MGSATPGTDNKNKTRFSN